MRPQQTFTSVNIEKVAKPNVESNVPADRIKVPITQMEGVLTFKAHLNNIF